LEDKLTESFCEMTTDTEYAFTTAEGDFDDRFVLHFNIAQVPTAIETPEKDSAQQEVDMYIQDKSILRIACNWENNEKTVKVYDLSGQQLLNETFEGNEFRRNLPFTKGIYLVKLEGEKITLEQKVFVQ